MLERHALSCHLDVLGVELVGIPLVQLGHLTNLLNSLQLGVLLHEVLLLGKLLLTLTTHQCLEVLLLNILLLLL
jgi:hypothetical protein